MCDGNYIKLNRKLLTWEWYKNENTKTVFLHCLLKANWKEGRFQGLEIPRGAFVTSRKKLAEELGMSEQNIRTSLDHLKSTGELTIKAHSKFSVVIVNNYESYQDNNLQDNQQLTNNQPTTNHNRRKKEGKKERNINAFTSFNGQRTYNFEEMERNLIRG